MRKLKTYCVQLAPAPESGDWPPVIRFRASSKRPHSYTFDGGASGGEVVAEITGDVAAWWIAEDTAEDQEEPG